ncbi:DUF4333 domain-containing protein [Conexibacter stalactiti]|uniref:DUF4333 domain-containing protein n=1 Tax=Conexibacter stalactiti TaxID=1940611 RepID=A0ABU4HMQ3_9ACTN|nr:DUF4333 domain-containing protein [Conexibacter stalactiti]MDW5594525.1 DUF4333 domain-containing protein [Conexibacter stalactiti]MEC5035167.1 DUF4333 domain-containing protein [Conexibacter stalactiti]
MKVRSRSALLALVLAGGLAVAGCGGTVIDKDKADEFAEKNLVGGDVREVSVDCPDDVDAKKGTSFRCDVVIDGERGVLTMHITSDEGNVEYDLARDLRASR